MRFIFIFSLLLSCPHSFALSILSYNVENLFDLVDDPNHADEEFLPKLHPAKKNCKKQRSSYRKRRCRQFDWNQKRLEQKLERLERVIASAKYPDVIGLVEVENRNVVGQLFKKMGKMYETIIVSQYPDLRGIRTAFVVKKSPHLKVLSIRNWRVEKKRKTRGILGIKVAFNNQRLCLLVNHWPSQGSKTRARQEAAKVLMNALREYRRHECMRIILGDFNTLESESERVFGPILKSGFLDTTNFLQQRGDIPGTYFFPPEMKWSFLDRIFVDQKLLSSSKSLHISVVKNKFNSGVWEQTNPNIFGYGTRIVGLPKRFHSGGVSDHFPLLLNISAF